MSLIKKSASFLFGEWSPPPWLRLISGALIGVLVFFWRKLLDWKKRAPKQFAWTTSSLFLVLVVGGLGYAWYRSLPKPEYLTWSTNTLRPTSLDANSIPEPLVVTFSGSAAPLDLIGKDTSHLISITPKLEGAWQWRSDNELVFTPASDWPVGQDEKVLLDKKTIASHVRLESQEISFTTPAFNATVDEVKFYEDPIDPKKKEVVATVSFTHPIDKTSFTKNIALKMRVEPDKSYDDSSAKTLEFSVDFSEKSDKAYIHSSSITIPKRDGEALVKVEKGVVSTRGGPGTTNELRSTVYIPGVENYFRITEAVASVVTRPDNEMERVLVVQSSAGMKQAELAKAAEFYLLPKDFPKNEENPEGISDYEWESAEDVTTEILKASKQINVRSIPSEREFMPLQSFAFDAPPGRHLYVRVKKGLKSFGDYPLVKDWSEIVAVEDFPQTVKILHEGSILSLSGSKTLSLLVRNIPGIRIEAGRLLPKTVHHLVSLNYKTMQEPSLFDSSFGINQLTEVITKEEAIPEGLPGKPQYTSINFGDLLSSRGNPRGLFLLKVTGWDPVKKEALDVQDKRLVLVTDMGVILKQAPSGDQDLYVQSIVHGSPVSTASVSILGANGLPLFTETSNNEGIVHFPTLKDFRRDKQPTVYVVERGDDFTFLPYQRYDRKENLSRFEIGGLYETDESEALQAYLFSSRGIYRPGDTVELGILLKRISWEPLPQGLPTELLITDPSGTEIRRETLKFESAGITEYVLPTEYTSPTGTYSVELYIIKDGKRNSLLGTTSFKVEEFQPDRMTLKSKVTPDPGDGWISPDDVRTEILLTNLYGTPAVKKKIVSKLELFPSALNFSQYPDFAFSDPFDLENAKSFNEDLGEFETDEKGEVQIPLRLDRFEKTSYTLHVTTQGFEAEGGRFVTSDILSKVSPAPYLVGTKADGELSYIKVGTLRDIELIAIDPKLNKIDLEDVTADLVQVITVSTLVKKEDGTFAYQAIKKEEPVKKEEITIKAKGTHLVLKTDVPGSFLLRLKDGANNELQKISYDVAGVSNLSGERTRNVELQIKLNKKEYSSGDDVELEVTAPYTGSGLITIERDKVYTHKWFTADTKVSTQTITVPGGIEGNAYLHVAFTRSLNSEEIYSSPFSYAVVPFSLSKKTRTLPINLTLPNTVLPGEILKIAYQGEPGSKVILFGVDEGILQVARYKTPDPLSHFMRKRALEIDTYQILDLLLPEYELVKKLSAPGGDEDALLKRHLNPFKRKSEKPIVFWSGVQTVPEGGVGTYEYKVPFYFNGTIRVMAVGANLEKIGAAVTSVISQGYFVLQPQVPAAVAPGDEFVTVVTVAAPKEVAPVKTQVTIKLDDKAEVIGDLTQNVEVPKGADFPVVFRLRAKNKLGAAQISFEAKSGTHEALYPLEFSVRPASLHFTTVDRKVVKTGILQSGLAEILLTRTLYPEHRDVKFVASSSPLSFIRGISEYLEEYPYGCAEQITSKAFPALILGANAEYGLDQSKVDSALAQTIRTLQSRQRPDGSIQYWSGSSEKDAFIDMYVLQFLLEGISQNIQVPKHLLTQALSRARDIAGEAPQSLNHARSVAYAIYLLVRNGKVVTNELTNLREVLDKAYAKEWRSDVTGLWVAATYKLLKLDREADMRGFDFNKPKVPTDNEFIDSNVVRGVMLSIIGKHFPEMISQIDQGKIFQWTESMANDGITTIGGAFATLGLDAYGKAQPQDVGDFSLEGVKNDKTVETLTMNGQTIKSADIGAGFNMLKLHSNKDKPLFLQLIQTGFDVPPMPEVKKDTIEVYREFQNEKGEPVSSISIDEPLFGVLHFRSLDSVTRRIAIVDLLPGGFELDLESRENIQGEWYPESIDMREDRLILFQTSYTNQRYTFKYRLKPTTQGTFVVPPVYAEGMYDLKARAWSESGRIAVTK